MASKIIHLNPFPRTWVRLTNLQFPGFSSLPFLEIGVTFIFFQSSGTFPDCCDLSNITRRGLSVTDQLHQHLWMHPIRSHGLLYVLPCPICSHVPLLDPPSPRVGLPLSRISYWFQEPGIAEGWSHQ